MSIRTVPFCPCIHTARFSPCGSVVLFPPCGGRYVIYYVGLIIMDSTNFAKEHTKCAGGKQLNFCPAWGKRYLPLGGKTSHNTLFSVICYVFTAVAHSERFFS